MQINFEEQIFQRKRFRRELLSAYGFAFDGESGELEVPMLDGEFVAELRVRGDGAIKGRVIDALSGEELSQLRNGNYVGAFIGRVRDAYEALLMDVAAKCCDDVAFVSEQANRIAARILAEFGVSPDFPWEGGRYGEYGVFRHAGSAKWFALIMNIKREKLTKPAGAGRKVDAEVGAERGGLAESAVDVINLKIEEGDAERLRGTRGIYPAYHMNHRKWISVLLDDALPDDAIMDLVERSYELTLGGARQLDNTLIKQILDIADSVPQGRVTTYGEIAKAVGRERNARLVGKIMSMADRYGEHPCHRVVSSSGRTVPGWKEQRGMLEAEGVEFRPSGLVDMKTFLWRPGE